MFSSVFLFFEFGAGEIMFIMLVALLLFGGDKLPELARGLGKGIRDFKDASEGVKREITNQIDTFEAKKTDKAKIDETPVAANESLVTTDEKPVFEAPANVVPISEISSSVEVEPVKEEAVAKTETEHLRETPIENTAKATHE